jgi:hypothetical protein
MKIQNHNAGNYFFTSQGDSSVMYGTITMTQAEYNDAIKYLQGVYKRTKNTYIRDSLAHVFNWTLKKRGDYHMEFFRQNSSGESVSLGVCATELLFKRYKLPRYKRQNYRIVVRY